MNFVLKNDENDKDNDERSSGSMVEEKLIASRSIFISGEIDQKLAQKVSTQLLVLQEISDEPIYLYINSQGGHVEAGDTIHDMIKFIKPEVIVIGTGWVASAGVTIYIAAKKENRVCLPNTRFMIHQPLGQVRGKVSDIQIEADEILRMRSRVNQMISEATGQPYEQVEKDTDYNFWMSPEEAVKYGLVSRVVSNIRELQD
ncbi:ATP-dependent Clp protease proteolytic subunit [Vibrio gazogenes]|uniref:ATP-dependent Clp protease proteolytic subunit n=1 Tax=Vibrio gazogenes DSM 21264 = NBRC 103151 TaxID=1123492 RepID=A0A1M5DQQ8_VIBGA|nr:ATP-dependent Clp protease proteolytic subunit [Vibrio gazogenes]USP14837.1 ATP-dependent Clp protease proteolytic subunit [Vibrio gazogenes]SHF69300.1 ATP-dependent Clp protease, protease subunit [Vibrio gazogenes DSM 21264] [Vibrio gazogenes DSM 21264 = NBRC 103151]SJN55261.1 ATP-dependent Clp protease proteolytic subunit precursor [Vibrio gazogenes]